MNKARVTQDIETLAMPDMTRRKFLQIVLGTIPAIAIEGPLAAVWPQDEKNRPLGTPWEVELEYGYLIDPGWDESNWPTFREFFEYDSMDTAGKIECLLDHIGYLEEELRDEYEIIKPASDWEEEQLEGVEGIAGSMLDDPVDIECMGFRSILHHGPHAVGELMLNGLPPEEAARLGLYLVEGDCPGSSFCGVRFTGDIDELNESLARHGLNIIVRGEV